MALGKITPVASKIAEFHCVLTEVAKIKMNECGQNFVTTFLKRIKAFQEPIKFHLLCTGTRNLGNYETRSKYAAYNFI